MHHNKKNFKFKYILFLSKEIESFGVFLKGKIIDQEKLFVNTNLEVKNLVRLSLFFCFYREECLILKFGK